MTTSFKENLCPRPLPRPLPACPGSAIRTTPPPKPRPACAPSAASSPRNRILQYTPSASVSCDNLLAARLRSECASQVTRGHANTASSASLPTKAAGLLGSSHSSPSSRSLDTHDMDKSTWDKPFARLRNKASTPMFRSASALDTSPRSSEETLTDTLESECPSSFRQRARNWARSPIPHWHGSKPKDLFFDRRDDFDDFVMVDDGSSTEVEPSDSESSDDEVIIPRSCTIPPAFKLQDPVMRGGSRQAPQPTLEVPYPICYDKVLTDSDDNTHDLIKALIPNRSGLTFHDFQKPPASVLDLGCGEGRWILEAATHWKHTRFVGLDLMDTQPELSGRHFEDVRDRVQWVHSNFLHYRLPFSACQFDFIRMSHIALAVPEDKWKHLLFEIRRVLKPNGIIEWIDEEVVLPLSRHYTPSDPEALRTAQNLESDFRAILRSRHLGKPLKTVKKLLRGRAMDMRGDQVTRFQIGLPGPAAAQLRPDDPHSSRSKSPLPPHMQMHKKSPRETNPSTKVSTPHYALLPLRWCADNGVVFQALPALPLSGHVPRGLLVLPDNKLLPLSPTEIEAHSSHNYQLVLGAAEAIWAHRQAKGTATDRRKFDDEVWSYE
ncbi:hypothetical protein FRB99_008108, partial [Tulasnella sp. 403]